jgi:hypothetical protein
MKQIRKVAKSAERSMIEVGSMDWMIKNLIFDVQMLKKKVEKLEGEKSMVDMIMAYLKSNKEEIIDGINKKVNLPLVSEAKEEKIFTSLFDAMLEVLEKVLNKKK